MDTEKLPETTEIPEKTKNLTKKQKLILLISLAALLVAALTVTLVLVLGGGGSEEPEPTTTVVENGLIWDFANYYSATLIGVEEGVTDVFIPSRFREKTVIVAANALAGSAIETLTFENCHLLSDGIEAGAFKDCKSLQKISVLSDGLTYVEPEHSIFEGCDAITEVCATATVLTYLAKDGGFDPAAVLTMRLLPNSSGETGLGYSSADISAYTGITKLILEEGITKVAYPSMANLTELTIPSTATEYAGWTNVNLPKLEKIYISNMAAYASTLALSNIGGNTLNTNRTELYLNGELVTDLVIPEGVTSIKSDAFSTIKGIRSVSLPSTLTSIGFRAFHGTELVTLEIPDSVTSIDRYAFGGIPTLLSLKLGSGLTSLSSDAFAAMSGPSTFKATAPLEIYNPLELTLGTLMSHAIMVYTDKNAESGLILEGDFVFMRMPDNLYYLVRCTSNASEITLPQYVKENQYIVRQGAFLNLDVVSVTIPATVGSVKSGAFDGCKNLVIARFLGANTSIASDWHKNGCSYMQIYHPTRDYSKNTVIYSNDANAKSVIDAREDGLIFFLKDEVRLVRYVGKEELLTLPADYEGGEYLVLERVLENVSTVAVPEGGLVRFTQMSFGDNTTVFELDGDGYYLGDIFFGIAANANPETLTIREGTVSIIGNVTAFMGGKTPLLKSVILPSTLKHVGSYAFNKTKNLESIEAGCTFESVGDSAFYTDSRKTTISDLKFAAGATVGTSAFVYVTLLGELVFEGAVTLGNSAFSSANISVDELILPAGSSIGMLALSGIQFNSLSLGDGTTLHHWMNFTGTIKKLTLGKNINLLLEDYSEFNGVVFKNVNVESVYVDSLETWIDFLDEGYGYSYTKPSGKNGFTLYVNNTPVTEITIPEGKGEMVGHIAGGVNTLTKLVISDDTVSLAAYTLSGCTALEEIVLGVGLTSIYIPATVKRLHLDTLDGWLSLTDASASRSHYGNITLYLDGTPLTEVTIPEGVTAIRPYAFYNFAGIERITVHDGVTTARSYSMYNPTLTAIEGCRSLTTIENNAIYNLDVLGTYTTGNVIYRLNQAIGVVSKDITWARILPGTVIPDLLFADCTKLTHVYVHDGCTFGQRIFANTNVNINVYLEGKFPTASGWNIVSKEGSSLKLGQAATPGNEYGMYGTVRERYMILNDFVFSVSSGKATVLGYFGDSEDVTIPETLNGYPVVAIGTYAFARRDGIKTLTVEADGITVKMSAFLDNTSLETVDLGSAYGVETSGFTNCTALTSFTASASDSHVFMLDGSFMNCPQLTDVTLPENTESLALAFIGCDALARVTMTGEWRIEEFLGSEVISYTASSPESNAAALKTYAGYIWYNTSFD